MATINLKAELFYTLKTINPLFSMFPCANPRYNKVFDDGIYFASLM
jgi:hypothetical protein